MGLPVAAIIAATAPVFGMSWYFDTENWAAGVWNSWAEARTDTWRAAMVEAEHAVADDTTFALTPEGVTPDGDFSFVVIGDTGEGDASQHVLRDRFLDVVQTDPVKFVVLSSDVIYPVGAMKDYEAKFWLPFKGTRKPVYAIPGNHDWYDALEAFNATFLEPDAARAAMRARIEVDNRLTTTTDARVDQLIAEASRLRREDEVPTQFQRAPFFQVQTDRFALIAIDTGVARTVDPLQLAWLARTLNESRGKLTMAVLGHPFYAGGHDTVGDSEAFGALRQLLREHDVRIVMAGDTHDLEYYAEQPGRRVAHGASLRQRRGRRLPELRHGALVAGCAGKPRLGVLPDDGRGRGQNRCDDAVVEMAGLVVDPPVRRVAVLGRVALGHVRRQRRALLPELRGGHRRAVGQPRPAAAPRRARAAALVGSGAVPDGQAARRAGRCGGRVDGGDARGPCGERAGGTDRGGTLRLRPGRRVGLGTSVFTPPIETGSRRARRHNHVRPPGPRSAASRSRGRARPRRPPRPSRRSPSRAPWRRLPA